MRIIAGSARGRQILSVPIKSPVRPISSRIRQSVFDIIRPKVMASRFLDLFAGTGAVGLEALSRGAHSVIFVDREKNCVNVIEKNLERLGFSEKGRVFRADILGGVSWLAHHAENEGYDIIFLGPPYLGEGGVAFAFTSPVLALIAKSSILAPAGWIVAQHHKKEKVEVPEELELFREAKYGDTIVSFLRKKKITAPTPITPIKE